MAPRPPKRPPSRPSRPVRPARPAPRSAAPRQRSRQTALDLPLLAVSAAAGLAAFLLGRLLEAALGPSLPRPVMMGLQFALLFALLAAGIFLYSHAAGIFEGEPLTGGGGGTALLLCLLGALLLFGLGAVFQWIYGTDFRRQQVPPTSYVFVIDDSGSMSGSDPDGQRYQAIAELLSDAAPDFPYMVYRFADVPALVRPMAPVSEGVPALEPLASGQTAIRAALTQALDDRESGVWDGGTSPRVVLLTDGYATDVGIFHPIRSLLRRYQKAGVSVSTIGLGGADERLLQRIAGSTGGVYLDVVDASGLSQAMEEAALRFAGRDLLSDRSAPRLGWLYALLRILFVTLLGFALGCFTLIPYGFDDSPALTILSSAVKALLGAVALEVGVCALGLPEGIFQFLLWLILALTLAARPVACRDRQSRTISAGAPML